VFADIAERHADLNERDHAADQDATADGRMGCVRHATRIRGAGRADAHGPTFDAGGARLGEWAARR
jgi:hypothetical protein